MTKRRYTKLTPKQEYEKYMRATDEWVKEQMLKYDAEIKVNLERMEKEREQA